MEFTAPPIDGDDTARVLGWGKQLDVRVVRDGHRTDDPDGPLTPEQVAGYLAKYATKDATSLRGGPGQTKPHLSRLTGTCRDLGKRARQHDRESPYLLLGKWAHMLGFRGHFSTKSRRYSVTLGRLRRARQRFQKLAAEANKTGERLDVRDLEERLLRRRGGDHPRRRVLGLPRHRLDPRRRPRPGRRRSSPRPRVRAVEGSTAQGGMRTREMRTR